MKVGGMGNCEAEKLGAGGKCLWDRVWGSQRESSEVQLDALDDSKSPE